MEDLETHVIRTAQAWLEQTEDVLLVSVSRTWGSSPRPPGSLMALNERGQTVGSVSGGCLEEELVRSVQDAGLLSLCPSRRPRVMKVGVSAEMAHRSGLPCGGTIELVLEPLSVRSRLDEWLNLLTNRQCGQRILNLDDGQVRFDLGTGDSSPRMVAREFFSGFGPRFRLLLIGAGDLSRYLSEIALTLNFEVFVCDPRVEQADTWHLEGTTLLRDMPDDAVVRLAPDERTAIVALTHDPKLDDLALIDALYSPAFYIGAIGSSFNSARRRARLKDHFGIDDEQAARMRGPAGIYIGSKTPPEIALSIMAEIVAAKNGIQVPRENYQRQQGEGALNALLASSCGVGQL